MSEKQPDIKKVTIVTDGSCSRNPGGYMAIGVLVVSEGKVLHKLHRKLGHGTNNMAEIHAMLEGVQLAQDFGYEEVTAYTDSELLEQQYAGAYRIKKKEFRPLYKQIRNVAKRFRKFQVVHHKREAPLAQAADALSKGKMDLSEFGLTDMV